MKIRDETKGGNENEGEERSGKDGNSGNEGD